MADWLPTDSTETLVAWYDASDTGSITESGGVVSAWADQTANGYDLAATGNPITGSTTLDGKNVIDMTSDYFMDTNVSMPSNLLVIAVIKINSVDDAFDSAFAADGGTDWQFEANTASSFEGQINNTSGGGSATNTSSIEDTWQVLSLEFDYSNTTNRIKLYGAAIASAGSAGDLSGSKTWTIGTNRNRNAHVNNMNVAEVILVDTNDQDEIAKFEGYLAWKWGLEASLDAGHEYYSAAPSVGGGTNYDETYSASATADLGLTEAWALNYAESFGASAASSLALSDAWALDYAETYAVAGAGALALTEAWSLDYAETLTTSAAADLALTETWALGYDETYSAGATADLALTDAYAVGNYYAETYAATAFSALTLTDAYSAQYSETYATTAAGALTLSEAWALGYIETYLAVGVAGLALTDTYDTPAPGVFDETYAATAIADLDLTHAFYTPAAISRVSNPTLQATGTARTLQTSGTARTLRGRPTIH